VRSPAHLRVKIISLCKSVVISSYNVIGNNIYERHQQIASVSGNERCLFLIGIKQTPTGAHPKFFIGGWGADPEAIYNLSDFKNYIILIMLYI
jgi:hypothetical protein